MRRLGWGAARSAESVRSVLAARSVVTRLLASGVALATVVTAAGCTNSPNKTDQTTLLVVGVDLPFQGPSGKTSDEVWNVLQLYLDRLGGKVGGRPVQLKRYDDATAARQAWDEQTCVANAHDHLATTTEVAVIGLPNAGCLKAEVPLLNNDPNGAMLTMSYAVSDPSLTKVWGISDPKTFAPSGSRSFARVIATDDVQGTTAAHYAATELKVTHCLVLNNGEGYGVGLAKAFADEARRAGVDVVGEPAWDRSQASYADLLRPFAGRGVDCVYLGGNFDDNGGQLIADKVAELGDNTAVKLLAPDGFAGYPALAELPAGQGTYLTTVGLSVQALAQLGGNAGELRKAYQAKFSAPLTSAAASYAVLALQVVFAAVSASDGSRRGVREAVFTGSGVSVPADVAAIGTAVRIDPTTGDCDARDVSLLVIRDNQESVVPARSGS